MPFWCYQFLQKQLNHLFLGLLKVSNSKKGKIVYFPRNGWITPFPCLKGSCTITPEINCVASLGSSLSCAVCNSRGSPGFGLSRSPKAKLFSCLLNGSAAWGDSSASLFRMCYISFLTELGCGWCWQGAVRSLSQRKALGGSARELVPPCCAVPVSGCGWEGSLPAVLCHQGGIHAVPWLGMGWHLCRKMCCPAWMFCSLTGSKPRCICKHIQIKSDVNVFQLE